MPVDRVPVQRFVGPAELMNGRRRSSRSSCPTVGCWERAGVTLTDRPRRLGFVLAVGLLTLAGWAVTPFASLPAWAQQSELKRHAEARLIPGSVKALPVSGLHAVKLSRSDPDRVYAAGPSGLLVSSDGGQSWSPLAVANTNEEVFTLAVHPTDPNAVFAGRRDGLWQTRDGGKLWTPLASPTGNSYIPLALGVAEARPDVIYVATARQGIYRSADGGRSWTSASNGLPEARAGGRPEEIRTLVVHPRDPDTAYVASERHGVYRTTDGGASWKPLNQGLLLPAWRPTYPPRLAFDPDDPDRLFLVFGQPVHSELVKTRLYVTSGSGRWLPVEVSLPANTRIAGLTVDRGTRTLLLWAEEAVWELPLSATAGPRK